MNDNNKQNQDIKMKLSKNQVLEIEEVLKSSLRQKFKNYNPEPSVMPFHTRLLGKDRMALFSFIHSLNTNFGTSIFEPVAIAIGASNFKEAKSQQIAGTKISKQAQRVIQDIMDGLTASTLKPFKQSEIEAIRKVCQTGEMQSVKLTKVDVYLKSYDDIIYLIDIKTAKPNKGSFKEFKRTLLECKPSVNSVYSH